MPAQAKNPVEVLERVIGDELVLLWGCLGHIFICDKVRIVTSYRVEIRLSTCEREAAGSEETSSWEALKEALDKRHIAWSRGEVDIQERAYTGFNAVTVLGIVPFGCALAQEIFDQNSMMEAEKEFASSFRPWVPPRGERRPQNLYVRKEAVIGVSEDVIISVLNDANVTMSQSPQGTIVELEFYKGG